MVLTASHPEPSVPPALGNGGNDTITLAAAVTASSSVVGGQGADDLSLVGSVTASTVSGNLGNDTMKLDEVVKSSSIYGGGGFIYDTSLDGADSIQITESVDGLLGPSQWWKRQRLSCKLTSTTAPFMAVKALI